MVLDNLALRGYSTCSLHRTKNQNPPMVPSRRRHGPGLWLSNSHFMRTPHCQIGTKILFKSYAIIQSSSFAAFWKELLLRKKWTCMAFNWLYITTLYTDVTRVHIHIHMSCRAVCFSPAAAVIQAFFPAETSSPGNCKVSRLVIFRRARASHVSMPTSIVVRSEATEVAFVI